MKRRALLLLTAMAAALTLGAGAAMAVVPAGDATTTSTQDNTTQQGGTTSSGVHTEAAVQQLVASWGRNDLGQLGNGTSGPGTNSNKPDRVSALSAPDIKALAGGTNHGLALKNDGTVWAWGDNVYGQLGNGTNGGNSSTPVQVKDTNGVDPLHATAIAAGGFHNLALKEDGTVVAWGLNTTGQLGNGTTGGGSCQCSNTPVAVSNLSGAEAIAGGADFSLALKTDGTVRSWGNNSTGQLGNGTTGGISNLPVAVSNLKGVTAISAGGNYGLALKKTRKGTVVRAWGFNNQGQLGNGDNTFSSRNTPVAVSNLKGVKAIAAGGDFDSGNHSLVLKTDGTVRSWGANDSGQLGNGTTGGGGSCNCINTPVTVSNLSGVTGIAAGGYHSLAK